MLKSKLRTIHFQHVLNPADKAIVDVRSDWTNADIERIVRDQAELMGRKITNIFYDRKEINEKINPEDI